LTDDKLERLFFRIAAVLSRPAWEVKCLLPWSEVVGWAEHFRLEEEETSKGEKMLASVAFQVYLLRASLPFNGFKPKATFDDFLLKPKKDKKSEEKRVKTIGDMPKPLQRTKSGKLIDPEWQARIDATARVWAGILGVGPDGVRKKKETGPKGRAARKRPPPKKGRG
jgi:hypothetical protein